MGNIFHLLVPLCVVTGFEKAKCSTVQKGFIMSSISIRLCQGIGHVFLTNTKQKSMLGMNAPFVYGTVAHFTAADTDRLMKQTLGSAFKYKNYPL